MTNVPEWTRIRALFEAALDVPVLERSAWLTDACAGDAALRDEVDALLDTEQADRRNALDRSISAASIGAVATVPLVGRRIGEYVVEDVLGAGGMSTVFLARQERPNRRVALKTVRLGLSSPHALQRFEYESEILAKLRHPAIAQVFEVGTWREPVTEEQLPFFAMELVEDARTLVQHVGAARLDTRAMLELFVRVCAGVEHGHRNGVVHRDLKPANILVDAHGHAKIIDFGIARALGEDREALTEVGQVVGTLEYMAPEQLEPRPEPIDTRADVYALGVVLYELLAGDVPHRLGDRTLTSFARLVQETEPRPPSALRPSVPEELDWIVGMAIAADRDRRYGSAAELAADIERFLRCEPVLAGPPTTAYRLRKFVRRNRVLVAGALAVLVALTVGGATTAWQMLRAESALGEALRQARRASTVNRFLVGILETGDPNTGGGATDLTVREALDRAAERLGELAQEPHVEAEVRFALGNAYRSIGILGESEAHLRRVLELRRDLSIGDDEDLAIAMNSLALTFDARGETERAIEWTREALAAFEAAHGPDHPDVAMAALNLGGYLINTEAAGEGVDALQRAVSIYGALPADRYGGFLATALSHLAVHARQSGDHAVAVARFRESLAAYRNAGKDGHPYAAMTRARLGRLLLQQEGGADEAVEILERAVEVLGASYGQDSVVANGPRAILGVALSAVGRLDEAERSLRTAETALSAVDRTDELSLFEARLTLSMLLQRRGESSEAHDLAERALALAEQSLDDDARSRARERVDSSAAARDR